VVVVVGLREVVRGWLGSEGGGVVVDTPQVPYPSVDRSRLTVSDAYRTSYAECRRDDSSHIHSR
jgi:hypothetical protein